MFSKIFIADMQILLAAFFFGIGFIGQRAISVDGLGPMFTNAFRFGLSAILISLGLKIMPQRWLSAIYSNTENGGHYHPNGGSTPNYDPKEKNESERLLYDIDNIEDKDMMTLNTVKLNAPTRLQYIMKVAYHIVCGNFDNLKGLNNSIYFWGIFLGLINFAGSGFQQWGIHYIPANKLGFIAGFDLFLTPIFSFFIPTFKKHAKITNSIIFAIFLSIFGLFLLSNIELNHLLQFHSKGEMLTLISTIFWTLHITYTDIATNYVDVLKMVIVQLYVVSSLSLVMALCFEPLNWLYNMHLLYLIIIPWIFFLSIVEGLGFCCMILGQSVSPPTHAAIILSLEGVFTSVFSYFTLNELLSMKELLGCIFMLIATLIAEIGIQALDNINFCGSNNKEKGSEGDMETIVTSNSNLIDIELGGPIHYANTGTLNSVYRFLQNVTIRINHYYTNLKISFNSVFSDKITYDKLNNGHGPSLSGAVGGAGSAGNLTNVLTGNQVYENDLTDSNIDLVSLGNHTSTTSVTGSHLHTNGNNNNNKNNYYKNLRENSLLGSGYHSENCIVKI